MFPKAGVGLDGYFPVRGSAGSLPLTRGRGAGLTPFPSKKTEIPASRNMPVEISTAP
jgi:hypothetical protein